MRHKMSTSNSKRHGFLWWSAFVIGLVYASLFTFVAIVGCSFYMVSPAWVGLLALTLFGSVAVAGKWKLVGGVLLIIECPSLIIWDTITLLSGFPMLHLPLLASGVLFLLSWREGRRPSKETGS